MREVVTYITRDEQLFHDKDAALEHEAKIDFAADYRSGKVRPLRDTTATYVIDWLFDNKKEVLKLYGIPF